MNNLFAVPRSIEDSLLLGGVAALVGLICIPLARFAGRKFDVVDHPDGHRKIHVRAIPVTGGYGIALAFLSAVVIGYLYLPGVHDGLNGHLNLLCLVVIGALFSMMMGGVDDVYEIRPAIKLILQAAASYLAYCGGIQITSITLPFAGTLELGLFALPVTVFWFMGCMNVINLLDGLDGLAGGVSLFTCFTMTLVGFLNGQPACMLIAAGLCGAILAFLVFNFNPASIFMGDAGSMFIGYMVAAISLLGAQKAETSIVLAVPFAALGLPILDTGGAMARRWARRVPVSLADGEHLHHVLIRVGLSHRLAVLLLYLICSLFGCGALLIATGHGYWATLLLGSLLFMVVAFLVLAGAVRLADMRERFIGDFNDRNRTYIARVATEGALRRMGKCASLAELWDELRQSFTALDLCKVVFRPDARLESEPLTWEAAEETSFDSGIEPVSKDKWSIFMGVHWAEREFGTLEVYHNAVESPLRESAFLLNRLRHGFGERLSSLVKAEETAVGSEKLKIAFFLVKSLERGGGIETYTYELARRLVRKGHQVTVYALGNYVDMEYYRYGIRVIPVRCIDHPALEKFSGAVFGMIKILLQPEHYDVIHCHSVAAGAVSLLLRLKAKRCLLQMHGVEWLRTRWNHFGRSFLHMLEIVSIRDAQSLSAVSRTQCRFYHELYDVDMKYIPTGSEIHNHTPIECADMDLEADKYIFFAARLVREKGAHHLISAFKKLDTDWKLVIAGDVKGASEYKDELTALAGDDPRIMFPGYILGDKLGALFSNAGIYVQPSELEGLAIALLEAMSYGRCCLVSDIPENKEAIGEAGRTFANADPDSLAAELQALIGVPDVRNELGKQAAQRVAADYSWDGIARSFENEYLRLCVEAELAPVSLTGALTKVRSSS